MESHQKDTGAGFLLARSGTKNNGLNDYNTINSKRTQELTVLLFSIEKCQLMSEL